MQLDSALLVFTVQDGQPIASLKALKISNVHVQVNLHYSSKAATRNTNNCRGQTPASTPNNSIRAIQHFRCNKRSLDQLNVQITKPATRCWFWLPGILSFCANNEAISQHIDERSTSSWATDEWKSINNAPPANWASNPGMQTHTATQTYLNLTLQTCLQLHRWS